LLVIKSIAVGCLSAIVTLFGILVIVAIASPTRPHSASTAEPQAGQLSQAIPTANVAPTKSAAKSTATPKPAEQGTAKNPYPRGAVVTVGEAKWKVLDATIRGRIPEEYGNKFLTAQGKYVVVIAEVENIGKQAKSVTQLDLVDSQGREFRSLSDRFKLDTKQVLIETLNPNMPLKYASVFDVPSDAEGLTVTVSDLSLFGARKAFVSLGDIK
jgi:hypothetical protein